MVILVMVIMAGIAGGLSVYAVAIPAYKHCNKNLQGEVVMLKDHSAFLEGQVTTYRQLSAVLSEENIQLAKELARERDPEVPL